MNPRIECQCGAIQITASRPEPNEVYCCHCLECQKQSSSAFGTSALFPADGMWPLPEDILSKLSVWTRPTEKGNTLECYFCKTCGVRIFHRSIFPDGESKPTLSVKGGLVEGLSWKGTKHIYTRSARVPVPEGSDRASPEA
ncbi:hypothetical protein FSARC_6719 [Fusarium sarcochroum]|uniref:CENP-V/GFA domain-containing protein n=1 Tax=Fusarium sarcochroum TaxID=1208366 RepID=A0A8H4TWV8_9HYPO|nr:hypothetical protein FSARC_6719 [Fusarium sarcochroum]